MTDAELIALAALVGRETMAMAGHNKDIELYNPGAGFIPHKWTFGSEETDASIALEKELRERKIL